MLRPNIKPPVVSQHWWFDVFNKMISLNKFKELLGDDAKGLNEKQIEDIYSFAQTLADATIENWMRRGKPSRMFMYDLMDPNFRRVILWYPRGINSIPSI